MGGNVRREVFGPGIAIAAGLAMIFGGACGESSDRSGVTVDVVDSDVPPPIDTQAELDGTATAPPLGDTQGPTVPPGSFGAPCASGVECDVGWCVPAEAGLVCSRGCIEACPDGWRCAGVSRTGGDIHFICLQQTAVLCHPCDDNAQCNQGVANEPGLCVSYGAEGTFCGMACEAGGDCPDGYSCDDVTTAAGQPARQCVRDGGVCECNGSAIQLARSTTCAFTNAFGTCAATRACGPDGLEPCSGAGAQPEVCNGLDDNCNGLIDDDVPSEPCDIANEHGVCQGQTSCVNAETICVGREPAPEECNGIDDNCDGLTDEGFPDTDGDGVADCVDPDIDGDGWLNSEDCDPYDATIYPGAPEVCDGRDNDCNGVTDDEGAEGCTMFLQDQDGDGYGNAHAPARCLCGPEPATSYVIAVDEGVEGDDCDDLNPNVHPGATEVCNGIDDNCDGQTDEGVASPCGGCNPVCLFEVGGDSDDPLDPEQPGQQNLEPDPDGGLRLTSAVQDIPFIWIANSAEHTVSKLDTRDGREVGRYFACSDPSRTAVDLNGDGIIACRGDGRVAKIAILEADCIDRNGNGVIDTARDLNGDGRIQANEMVADDECVLWVSRPDDAVSSGCSGSHGCARATGVDKDNNVWVGMWNSSRLFQLESSTGATLRMHQLTARPYGLAIAADQTIWVASRSPHSLVRVDPVQGQVSTHSMPGSRQAYGLALDHMGRVWVATGSHAGLSRFDPATNSWNHLGPWASLGWTRGVATRLITDAQGAVVGSTVYVAHHTWDGGCSSNPGTHRTITVVDAGNLNVESPIDLGSDRGPVGVAVDIEGQLWTVNQCASTASKVDTATKTVTATFPTGSGPYTYSDMTGYALRNITAPSGYYRQVFTGWESGSTVWDAIFVEATLPGDGASFIRIRYRAAASEAQLQAASWSTYYGPYPPAALPLRPSAEGYALEVEVTLQTDDSDFIPVLHRISVLALEQ